MHDVKYGDEVNIKFANGSTVCIVNEGPIMIHNVPFIIITDQTGSIHQADYIDGKWVSKQINLSLPPIKK